MKKLTGIVLCAAVCLLSGCDKKEENALLEFPDTQWTMSMSEVLDSCKITQEDTALYNDQGRGPSFSVENQEVFGATASAVHYSFINLELGESENLQDFNEETMAGKERLGSVTVIYPAETDGDAVLEELNKKYGTYALPEVTLYSSYTALDSGTLESLTYEESDKVKVWGSDTVDSVIDEKNETFYQENWGVYLKNLNEENWADFSKTGRMVTIVYAENEENVMVHFYGYNLAVYNELTEQLGK